MSSSISWFIRGVKQTLEEKVEGLVKTVEYINSNTSDVNVVRFFIISLISWVVNDSVT